MSIDIQNPFNSSELSESSILIRQEENLNCLKKHYPRIHSQILAHGNLTTTVNIDTRTGKADLIDETGSHYGGDAFKYCRNEIEHFLSNHGAGNPIKGMKPSFSGDYYFPRFFNRIADELITTSPLSRSHNLNQYKIPNFYPQLIFLGCGFGLHIEHLLSQYEVHRAVILEPDINLFIASLMIVDWKTIIEKRLQSNLPMISLFVGGKSQENIQQAAIWNHLIQQCPAFPLTTIYYCHRQKTSYKKMCAAFDAKTYVFLSGWGHYDDEINQLNQTMHNIQAQPLWIREPNRQLEKQPVAIVGSGPSLDQRLDLLVNLTNTHLIISCGSSITALYKLGIKPDIHIELESDYQITVGYLETIDDPTFLQGILMLGPVHLNPLIYNFFGKSAVFLKEGGCSSTLLKSLMPSLTTINHCTPTCVNLAVSLVLTYGATDISLFGTDFGFYELDKHHAEKSVYYYEDVHSSFKDSVDFEQYDIFEIDSVHGDKILTQPLYYSAKERVENTILYFRKFSSRKEQPFTVKNYSLGAAISGTDWIEDSSLARLSGATVKWSASDILRVLSDLDQNRKDFIKVEPPDTNSLKEKSLAELTQATSRLYQHIEANHLHLLKDSKDALKNYDLFCHQTIALLRSIQNELPTAYSLLKGSLWHFLHIGYSHLLGIHTLDEIDDKAAILWVEQWLETVCQFLQTVPNHFKSIIYKDYTSSEDPWIRLALTDPE